MRERVYWVLPTALVLLLPARLFSASPVLLLADAESPLIQNERADRDDLSRMRDAAMVRRFARNGWLVHIPAAGTDYYVYDVAAKYRYARPWTKLFLARLSRQYRARFGQRLRVTSLVRTEGHQRHLAQINANAASSQGLLRSSHLTGATVDISKRFMSGAEVRWVRSVLYSLHSQGFIYAFEEFRQPVFHIMVYRSYSRHVTAITRASNGTARARSSLHPGSRTVLHGHLGQSVARDAAAKTASAGTM